jgi:hypothetical protein
MLSGQSVLFLYIYVLVWFRRGGKILVVSHVTFDWVTGTTW